MVKGIFAILLPVEADYNVLGYYFSDKRIKFEVTSNIFLRMNLDHEKKEYNLLNLKDITIASYLHKPKGKLSRKAIGLIIGIILDEDDDTEKLRTPLKNAAEVLEKLDLIQIKKEEIETKLESIYKEQLDTSKVVVDAGLIKENVINRAKNLLGGKKQDREVAQELLQFIEEGLNNKVQENHVAAENAIKQGDLKKAALFLDKAAEFADKLIEKELTKYFRNKAESFTKIPELQKKMESFANEARSRLKNEDFKFAYQYYKNAAEVAKELMDLEREEEYRLKAKALQEFYEIDEKFKKK